MEIHILDSKYGGDPEALSMMQAFYSRSNESIASRVTRLGTNLTAVKQALHRYFVGYGHQSIGDCGTVTLFIEGVSILAAKALQENPLYNGQECSTRYIELTGSMYEGSEIANWWQSEYHKVREAVLLGVRAEHPFEGFDGFDINNSAHTKAGSQYAVWENATAARAFDVARGWIPCDALTNLSWTVTLRKATEVTTQLSGHPMPEVRELAVALRKRLCEVYPHGIAKPVETDAAQAEWLASGGLSAWYCAAAVPAECTVKTLAFSMPQEQIQFVNSRPRHTSLPHGFENYGRFLIKGRIDYGTWRDMQRHRRNIGLPPAVQPNDFHDWYCEQVQRYVPGMQGDDFVAAAINQLDKQRSKPWDVSTSQYDCPLGAVVPYEYEMGLAQALYFAELRSGNTVHPILRPIAQQLAQHLRVFGIRVDNDNKPARFDLRRGTQTIYEKESA
jgi:thymidylate synthase ThyX